MKKFLTLLKNSQTKYIISLVNKKVINHDTRCFRFGLPTSDHVLGVPVGQHIQLCANIKDQIVFRCYTPISSDDEPGFIDLPIKVYFKNANSKFPEGGRMSQHLEQMKVGDTIECRGPFGRLKYNGSGLFSIRMTLKDPPVNHSVKKISMLAGGTGITPMLQLIRAISKDPSDQTEVSLLFANRSEEDVLFKKELDEIVENSRGQIRVWYTISESNEAWKYSSGHITGDMIQRHLHPPASETMVLMCGPKPMIQDTCVPNLNKLGYDLKLRFCY